MVRRWLLVGTVMTLVLTAPVSGIGLAHADTSATGVQLALTPATQIVALGADVFLDITVTQPSGGYNAWEATIVFDPTALTYVPAALQSQQGCLMTGGCSNACGNTFVQLAAGTDSVYVIDGISCFQTYITAPGQLFRFHFRAASTARQTSVYFKSPRFAGATQEVTPVIWSPAQIGIGMPAAAVDPRASASGLRLSAAPNPARGSVMLALGSEQSGEQELAVHDVQGRSVRVLSRSWQAAGDRQLVWDGTDDSGARAAPGVYLVMLRVGNRRTQSRVTLLD